MGISLTEAQNKANHLYDIDVKKNKLTEERLSKLNTFIAELDKEYGADLQSLSVEESCLIDELRAFHKEQFEKDEKTYKNIDLLKVKLTTRQPGKSIVKTDDKDLLEWAQQHHPDVIKSDVKWADLKKKLVITPENKIADIGSGLFVDKGVAIKEGETEFGVKVLSGLND